MWSLILNKLNIKASRDDYSIIQKNDVYERISKIKFSLTSIFDNIYEKWNGKIAEFSFWEEIENSKEFNPKLSYRRFESMLSQISNIVSGLNILQYVSFISYLKL